MTLTPNEKRQFKARRVHYMALVLGGLLLLEHYWIVPVLMAGFLFYCYKFEQLMHDHGRSSKYWKFQAQYMNKKMIWARFELIEWRKRKLAKEMDKRKKRARQRKMEEERKKQGDEGGMFWGDGRALGQCEIGSKKNALDLASEEIWMQILKKVEDPKDSMSCYYTCSLFQNLLETRMRAEAFLVLDNYMEKNADQWGLQNEDILNCRLVSTSWKLSVDHFLQHNPSQVKFLGHCYPTTVIDSNEVRQLEGLIQRLLRNYHHNSTNPFPSRHLQVKLQSNVSEKDRKAFLAAVSVLLQYFGKHIWYLTLYIFINWDAVASYKTVYTFLGQTPHLQMLDLCFHGNSKKKATRQEIRELGDFVTFNTFPRLNRLIATKFDGVPDDIISSALKANKLLDKLDITPLGSNHAWIKFNGRTHDLPQLQDCSISNIRVPQLVELQNVNWPLTRLTVELGEIPNEPMDLEKLFSTFEKFEATLKYLNFGTKGRSMAMARLVLPHLEEVEVHFVEKVLMDFIIPLRSLKRIKVHIYNERLYNDEHELEIVKFKDAVRNMHKQDETNIWRLFPELMNVTIVMIRGGTTLGPKEKTYLYTRHGDKVTKTFKIT